MASNLLNVCVALLIAMMVFSVAASAAPARNVGACMDNRAVQALIASHQIRTWPAIKALAGISEQYKEVSAVGVCRQDGAPSYVVNVAGPAGESKQLVLNAINGSK